MRKIAFILLSVSILHLCGCGLLIVHPISEELEIKNLTGQTLKIKRYDSTDFFTLKNDDELNYVLGIREFIKISFDNPNEFYEYDLSNIDKIARKDSSKLGSYWFSLYIHWVYPCKVLKNKTLVFYEGDTDISIIYPVSFKKNRIILRKKAKTPALGEPEIIYPPNKDNQK